MGAILSYHILLFAAVIQLLNLIFPSTGEAITRWNGLFSAEETYAETPQSSTNLFQGRFDLDIKPPTKKRLDTRFNVRVNFTESDTEKVWSISPIGNLGVDLTGDTYNLNLKHSNYATVSTTAALVETEISRAALTLTPRDLPRAITNYTTTVSSSEGTETQSDNFSFFSDYAYKWLNFRGGYSKHDRSSGGQETSSSDSLFWGTGGSYEVLPGTVLSGDFDTNYDSSDTLSGFESKTVSRAFRLSANSRLREWLNLSGNFSKDISDFESSEAAVTSTERQNMDTTARLYPWQSLQIWTTIGNRKFNDVDRQRSVDYGTVAASFLDDLRENLQVGLGISRTVESDPEQGDNTRDSLNLNSTLELTPRVSARINLTLGRSESPGFVSATTFDASGTFADRAVFDDRPAGFTFFDDVNNELYTKGSINLGDWSDPVHFDPVVEQFSVTKTALLNMIPTDKTSLVLSYSSNFSGDELEIADAGNQSINGSFNYRPNLRTSYSLTGTASLPQTGSKSYAGTLSMAYRFYRGHQMNLNYSSRYTSGKTTDTFSGSVRFTLRKRTSLDITYSTGQLFSDEQTQFVRARLSKSF